MQAGLDHAALQRAVRKRAQLTRSEIFGASDSLMPVSEVQDASTAAPGMIGTRYSKGNLVLLSINPAGGKDDSTSSISDREMYAGYRALGSSSDADLNQAFATFNAYVARQMPSWRVYKQHTNRILEALDLELDEIAYLYVVPFRTRADDGARIPVNVVDRAYDAGLDHMLALLSPKVLVAIDRHSERCAIRYSEQSDQPSKVWYYTRKRDAHTERAELLDAMRRWTGQRPVST